MSETINTSALLIFFSLIIAYMVYKVLEFQSRPKVYQEGFSGNCSISEFKDNVNKLKEKIEGSFDISKNKKELEDIITNSYDIVNHSIVLQLCSLTKSESGLSDAAQLMKINSSMQVAQGLQKLMTWLDSQSGSSSGGMFG